MGSLEVFRLMKVELVRAITEDEVGSIPGEAPAFTLVVEVAEVLEGFPIIDESAAAFPFELVEFVIMQGEALAKKPVLQF